MHRAQDVTYRLGAAARSAGEPHPPPCPSRRFGEGESAERGAEPCPQRGGGTGLWKPAVPSLHRDRAPGPHRRRRGPRRCPASPRRPRRGAAPPAPLHAAASRASPAPARGSGAAPPLPKRRDSRRTSQSGRRGPRGSGPPPRRPATPPSPPRFCMPSAPGPRLGAERGRGSRFSASPASPRGSRCPPPPRRGCPRHRTPPPRSPHRTPPAPADAAAAAIFRAT